MLSRDDIGIMVVDPSETYQRIFSSILRRLGFHRVVRANNSMKAQVLLEHDKSINVVFCELMLPDPAGGINFVRQVRKRFGADHLPMLMMSNNSERSYVEESLRAGVKGYLIKPINPDHLEAHLWRLFDLPLRGPRKIGEFLVEEEIITNEQRDLALSLQRHYSSEFHDLSRLALYMGYVRLAELQPVFEQQLDAAAFLAMGDELGMTENQVETLRRVHERHHLRFGDVLVKIGVVDKHTLENALARFKLRCISEGQPVKED